MKIKTADLIGPPLDWAMATALGHKAGQIKAHGPVHLFREIGYSPYQFSPSTTGDTVIDIMEQEKISALFDAKAGLWQASTGPRGVGPTLRIAVCRCFVASKLGDEVDIPEELMK